MRGNAFFRGSVMRVGIFALCLVGFSLFAKSSYQAAAQMTPSGCLDMFGQPILALASHRIRDVGLARRDKSRGPVIIYNPRRLARLKPSTRVFFYAHECAHHALGHTVGLGHPLAVEQDADCWAIRNLVKRNIFSHHDIKMVQTDLAKLGRGDRTHLPGPERAKRLPGCLAF